MTGDSLDAASRSRELRLALEAAVGLPTADVESISVLIQAGEWRVALEALCTQTYEHDLDVSDAQRSLLSRLGAELDVPVEYLLGDPWAASPDQP